MELFPPLLFHAGTSRQLAAADVSGADDLRQGYFAFVKVLEITGGVVVAIPRTRPLGLLGEVMRRRARQGMSPIAGDNVAGGLLLSDNDREND